MTTQPGPWTSCTIRTSEEKKVRLYEFSALVSYGVVVAATSEEEAKKHISDWEHAWKHQEFQSVSDVDLFEIREVEQTPEASSDSANEVTIESQQFLYAATLSDTSEVKP